MRFAIQTNIVILQHQNIFMLKVFKFGGASVKDADSVRNVATIVKKNNTKPLVIVVSAMGKTTNALEKVVTAWYENDVRISAFVEEVIQFHQSIINALFPDKSHSIYYKADLLFGELEGYVSTPCDLNFDYDYDQVVSIGELLSTTIISEYLSSIQLNSRLFDARELILTDETWREGKVNWQKTQHQIQDQIQAFFDASHNTNPIAITQGFIGGTDKKLTTTLGREGSDYTAAIIAHSLNANEMTVWKDVPGLLNADPKHFENTYLLTHISYREAIELAYYGASVIHPKTIKPLQNKGIILKIKSFVNPDAAGTSIGPISKDDDKASSIILKSDQTLLSFLVKDFSFIAENNLSEIFSALAKSGIRVNMMQQSAISFSICFDENARKMDLLLQLLGEKFEYRYNTGLQLITVRHYEQITINKLLAGRQLLLEQRSRTTAQFVVKEK